MNVGRAQIEIARLAVMVMIVVAVAMIVVMMMAVVRATQQPGARHVDRKTQRS